MARLRVELVGSHAATALTANRGLKLTFWLTLALAPDDVHEFSAYLARALTDTL